MKLATLECIIITFCVWAPLYLTTQDEVYSFAWSIVMAGIFWLIAFISSLEIIFDKQMKKRKYNEKV